jgi:hypothetical protein
MANMKIRLKGGPDDGKVLKFELKAAMNLIDRDQAEEVSPITLTYDEEIAVIDKKRREEKNAGNAPENKAVQPPSNKRRKAKR